MPKLVVHEKELRTGFKKNREAANVLLATSSVPAGSMLLFYAVECGLKHILCVRNRGSYLEGDSHLLMTHDLIALIKELRLSIGQFPQLFKLNRDARTQYPSSECHLAWRYGPSLLAADEQKLRDGLLMLAERIAEDIP